MGIYYYLFINNHTQTTIKEEHLNCKKLIFLLRLMLWFMVTEK